MASSRRAPRRALTALTLGGLVAAPLGLAASADAVPAHDSTIFVNELHYDNAGTDSGELIEVAGPAGTDLSGWSLVLYNGSNGSAYNTRELSGTIPDQSGGYGTVDFPIAGLQNGSPDGVALVNGTQVETQSFTSVAAADAYFTDHPLDLGQLSGTTLDVDIHLSEVFSTAGSGYAFGIVAGEAPSQSQAHRFLQAMAFAAPGSAALSTGPDAFTSSANDALQLSLPGHA